MDGVIAEITAKYGPNVIMRANAAKALPIRRVTTGISALDFAIGGGYPLGRYVHIFGREGAGKTFLAMKAVAATHARDSQALAVWIDVEQVFDPARAVKVGIDLGRLIVIREPSIEAAIRQAEEFLDVEEVAIYVVDSVAGIMSVAEIEGDVEDQTMGLGARFLNRFIRRWTAKNTPRDDKPPHSFMLLLNQVRETIRRGGNPNVPPKPKPPGGHGIRFFASIEIEVTRGDAVDISSKEDDSDRTVVGFETKCLIVKNNTYAPLRVGQFMLCVRPFDNGEYKLRPHEVDEAADILRYATHNGIMSRGGAWITYGTQKWNGKIAAQGAIHSDAALKQELYLKIMGAIDEKLGVKKAATPEPSAGKDSLPEKFRPKAPGKRKPVAQQRGRKG